MAKLTREQVNKWNDGNKNGFQFSISYYIFHGEKTPTKDIKIDEDHILTVHLMYREDWNTNVKYADRVVLQIPTAHFAVSLNKGGMMVSHGLGYWHTLGEARNNKSYAVLQKLTETLDDSTCLAIFDELKKTQVNQYA